MNWIGVGIAVVGVTVLGVIAIPGLKLARMTANEAGARKSLLLINAAEVNFAKLHPDQGYACSLRELGMANQREGYLFEISDCEPQAPNKAYRVSARPAVKDQTGYWAFCSDEGGVIKGSSESVEDCRAAGVALTPNRDHID